MEDDVRIWTTVGSAGSLTANDLAKVGLDNGVISLGHDIAPPAANAPKDPSVAFPPVNAVVRYNVTPVDGLFFPTAADVPPGQDAPPNYHYQLQVCYLGAVKARLVQVALANGEEKGLLLFDSASFDPAHSFVMNAVTTTDPSTVMDFVNFAYYVEATLSASSIGVGNPASIAVIKVYPSPDFQG
jgi:hypothetical protein